MASSITRLNLTKRLARWSGVVMPSKVTSTTSPDTDKIGDLVAFVDQAWLDIQLLENNRWNWMRERSFDDEALTADTRTLAMSVFTAEGTTYRTVVPFIAHDVVPLRYIHLTHPTTSSVHRCEFVNYEMFRGYRDKGSRPTQRPTRYTVRKDGTLEFDPTPDVAYTINCDIILNPSEFSGDNDVPNMPNHFHMLIVWWAMVH